MATLKGSYGVVEQGVVVMNIGIPIPVPFPTANVALVTYDGAGNLSATYNASYGGIILGGTVQGTYTVDPDCTYYDSVPTVHLERKGTIVGEGMLQKVHAIYTVDWIVGGGTRWKTPVGECSAASLKGPALPRAGEGTMHPPASRPFPGGRPDSSCNNGRGNFYGNETVNVAGETEHNTFTGTYTVTPDCSVSAELSRLQRSQSACSRSHRRRGRAADRATGPIAQRGWVFVAAIDRQ